MTESLATSPASNSALQSESEFDLLCALAGAELSPERIERIANWNFSTLDWSEVLRLAEHHGVLPLAARNLTEHGHGLPPEIERSLRSAYETNLRRSLWFTAELARIMQHFERQQLRAVPYKGPVLAQSLYRDLGLRSFGDLDFLISSVNFERAKQALAEIGYRPSANLTPAVERFWLHTGYERAFDSAAGKNLVELQWALLPHFYAIDLHMNGLRVEDLLARAGRTVVVGREVPCLSPEDSLLVLCLHAAKHLWTRLIWLADIAETLSVNGVPGVPARLNGREARYSTVWRNEYGNDRSSAAAAADSRQPESGGAFLQPRFTVERALRPRPPHLCRLRAFHPVPDDEQGRGRQYHPDRTDRLHVCRE